MLLRRVKGEKKRVDFRFSFSSLVCAKEAPRHYRKCDISSVCAYLYTYQYNDNNNLSYYYDIPDTSFYNIEKLLS